VISHAVWREVFGSDPHVLGRSLTVSRATYQVVGVLPSGFQSPSMTSLTAVGLSPTRAVWTPFVPKPVHNLRGNRGLRVLAKVAASTDERVASLALATLSRQLSDAYPDTNRGKHARLVSLAETIAGPSRRPLIALLAAAVMVLLIACTNAAGLVMVRTHARTRELVVRMAVGAGRGRLVRQLAAESVLTASLGGALGLLLTSVLLSLLRSSPIANAIPRLAQAGVDGRTGLVGMTIAIAIGLIAGLTLTMTLSSIMRGGTLVPSGGRATDGRREARTRQLLVAAQVALALTLAVSATLLMATFRHLNAPRDLPEPHRTLTFQTTVAGTRWGRTPADHLVYGELLGRLRSIPGVEAASVTTQILDAGDASISDVLVEGQAPVPATERPLATHTLADTDLPRVSGVIVQQGRWFARDDRADGPRIAVVNDAFVRALQLAAPIGQRVRLSGLGVAPFEIVGVTGNSQAFDVGATDGPRLYYHYAQVPAERFIVLVRFAAGREVSANAVRQALHDLDPQLPMLEVQTVAALLDRVTARPRWGSAIVASFALLAVLLACVGIYGVVAFAAARRIKECGIRVALGATRTAVCGLIAREALTPVALGLIVGTLTALAAQFLLHSMGMLNGLEGQRWVVVAATEIGLGVTAALAGLMPAVRAAADLDSLQALRRD
jgi:predicted permease